MKWLMAFLVECYEAAPAPLNVQIPQGCDPRPVHALEAEADERCSFGGKKAHKQWRWLALDTRSRQVLAFHVGERSQKSARRLGNQLPAAYRERATFHTDAYAPYGRVIPQAQHRPIPQGSPQDQSGGALQRDLTAATLTAGSLGVVVFEKLDPSPRRHPLFPLPL
jgi:IS1 transposase